MSCFHPKVVRQQSSASCEEGCESRNSHKIGHQFAIQKAPEQSSAEVELSEHVRSSGSCNSRRSRVMGKPEELISSMIQAFPTPTPLESSEVKSQEISQPSKLSNPFYSFIYSPLPTNTSFRLLTLLDPKDVLGGSSESLANQISATLQIYDLDDAPPFRALSYTWGPPYREDSHEDFKLPPELTTKITCNGQDIPITQNLYDALVSLRDAGIAGFYGLLWVDALCINQADFPERSSQVSLMGKIYSSASEVLAWLGPPKEGFEDFIWVSTFFLSRLERRCWFKKMMLLDSAYWPRLLKWAAFYCSCRWFSRAWVVQEVLLSHRVRLFCGVDEIQLDRLMQLISCLVWNQWHFMIGNEIQAKNKGVPSLWLNGVIGWNNLRNRLKIGISKGPGREGSAVLVSWLSEVLVNTSNMTCQDPRDAIYSVLGIVDRPFKETSIAKLITPDYKRAVAEVFTAITTLVLEHSNSLLHFAETRRHYQTHNSLNLPSWVVDYSSTSTTTPLSSENGKFVGRGLKFPRQKFPRFSIDGISIRCYGACFETVGEEIDVVRAYRARDLYRFLQNLLQLWISLSPEINGRARKEVLWRTLITDEAEGIGPYFPRYFTSWLKVNLSKLQSEELTAIWATKVFAKLHEEGSSRERQLVEDVYRLFLRSDKHSSITDTSKTISSELFQVGPDSSAFGVEFSRTTIGRDLFKTEGGFVGLGCMGVQRGDQVWHLTDADTLFLLRPAKELNTFTLVGDCYLLDFMHGEMLRVCCGLADRIRPITIV